MNPFRSPFVFADDTLVSAMTGRRGLLARAMPPPSLSRYAAPVRWRSADGQPLDREGRLPAMRGEIERLLTLSDPAEDPVRYREILMAAATGDALAKNTSPELRDEYFSILHLLYGGLTLPGGRLLPDYAALNSLAIRAVESRFQGTIKGVKTKKEQAAKRMAEAKRLWEEYAAQGRPEHEIASLVAARMGVKPRTVRGWKKSNWGNG